MGGGTSKFKIGLEEHKLVLVERDELAAAKKAKEKMLALLHRDHEKVQDSFREHQKNHLDIVSQNVGLKLQLERARHKHEEALNAARRKNDARVRCVPRPRPSPPRPTRPRFFRCEEELAVLRKRVGAMTHGNGERDIQEREKIIAELEELQGSVEKGPMQNMFALVIGNLRREMSEIAARLPSPD